MEMYLCPLSAQRILGEGGFGGKSRVLAEIADIVAAVVRNVLFFHGGGPFAPDEGVGTGSHWVESVGGDGSPGGIRVAGS